MYVHAKETQANAREHWKLLVVPVASLLLSTSTIEVTWLKLATHSIVIMP